MKMKLRHHYDRVTAIEGSEEAVANGRVIGSKCITVGSIKEAVICYHILGHVVCPFQDLGPNVDKKDVRGSAAKNHDFSNRVIHEEEGYSGPRSNGFAANVKWV
jgi:hypothetical protein